MPLTADEARALWRKRKSLTRRRSMEYAAQKAKADARARRLLDMVDQGMPYDQIAEELGIRVASVRGAVRAAKKRLASTV